MKNNIKIGLPIGIIGFFIALFLMFVSMGFPILNIIFVIPLGITTGKLIARDKQNRDVNKNFVFKNAIAVALLTVLGTIIPLLVIVFMSPKEATIGDEFSKWIDPNTISRPLNSLPIAMTLGRIISAVLIFFLIITSCNLIIKKAKKRKI